MLKKKQIVTCTYNATNLLDNLFQNMNLVRRDVQCSICDPTVKVRKYNTLMLTSPFGEIISLEGMTKLQECCNNITNFRSRCNLCGQDTIIKKHQFKNVLIIDLEYIFIDAMSKKLKILDVSNTPKVLDIDGKKYEIVGLVEFTPNHYIAHCYVNGSWIVKNDLSTSAEVKPNLSDDVKICFIIYAVCNEA